MGRPPKTPKTSKKDDPPHKGQLDTTKALDHSASNNISLSDGKNLAGDPVKQVPLNYLNALMNGTPPQSSLSTDYNQSTPPRDTDQPYTSPVRPCVNSPSSSPARPPTISPPSSPVSSSPPHPSPPAPSSKRRRSIQESDEEFLGDFSSPSHSPSLPQRPRMDTSETENDEIIARLLQAEADHSSRPRSPPPSPPRPPSPPNIVPNGSRVDANSLIPNAIDQDLEDAPGPIYYTFTLNTENVKEETFYSSYVFNFKPKKHQLPLPMPTGIVPSLKKKCIFFRFEVYEDFKKFWDHEWPKTIGIAYKPDDYDPLAAGDHYYTIYLAGLGSSSPRVSERIKKQMCDEKLEVATAKPSYSGQHVAVYINRESDWHSLLTRKKDNGRYIIKASNASELSLVFTIKKSFASTNAPHLHKIRVTNGSQHEERFVAILRNYVAMNNFPREDILYYFPQTRKGSTDPTSFGFLWVRSIALYQFFLHTAVLSLRGSPIVFSKPELFKVK